MKAKEKYKNHHQEINQKKSQTQWQEETPDKGEKRKKVYSKTYGINTNKCIYRLGRAAVSLCYSSSRDVALRRIMLGCVLSLLIVEAISGIP